MATIKDVAKKAGVSIGVVSRAFNNYPDISEKTRQKIFEVAKELNYTPNVVARNLSLKKQFTIGLISSGILDSDEKDTGIAFELFKGVYVGTQESGYELAIYLIDSESQHLKNYAQFCRERNIGGAILQGIRTDDPYFKEMIDANIPCVLIDAEAESCNNLIGSISSNNVAACQEMTNHLLKTNHKNIVIMSGKEEAYVDRWRLEGVKKAFQENGLTLSDDQILQGSYSEAHAYEAAKEYLKHSQPDAFLCFSDLMALGVYKAIREAGLRIPEDISVTGFDGLMFTEFLDPPLTTVKQDFFEMGRQAVILLQRIMEGLDVKKHILVDHQFIERESVNFNR